MVVGYSFIVLDNLFVKVIDEQCDEWKEWFVGICD